jgi:glycosyl transferase family 25
MSINSKPNASRPEIPIYVINLARDTERLQYLEALFSRHELSFERIEAVDGRRLSELQGPEIRPVRISPRVPRGLLFKDQGLTMSHRKAALRMLASGAQVACIMEDDADFGPSFPRLLAMLASDQPADIVKLEGIGTVRRVVPVGVFADRTLAVTANPVMGAAAYLVTRHGAQSIIELTETVGEPFDNVLANVTGSATLVHLLPYPVHQRPEARYPHADKIAVHGRPVTTINRIRREFYRFGRHGRDLADIVWRYPRQAWRWKRMALQER